MSQAIDELCRALRAAGITCVFGVPGTQNVHLFEGFRRNGLRTVLTSHELAAAFMANGYYRARGKVAALATIPGPGFTYALTGLAEARLDSAAILYLVGKPATQPGNRFQLQAIDQRTIAGPLVKECFALDGKSDVADVIGRACAASMSGEPGPVMVELEMESLVREPFLPVRVARATPPQPAVIPGLNNLRALFDQSRRPIFLLGQGAFDSADRLRTLAESLNIPVIATPTARGVLPEDHRLAMSFDSLRNRTVEVNQLLDRSDLIVGLGCKLGHNGSAGFSLRLPPERFVHVDAGEGVVGANYPTRLGITCRVEVAVTELEARDRPTEWTPEELSGARESLVPGKAVAGEPFIHGESKIQPNEFFNWLRGALPRDAIVVTDSGLHQIMTRRYLEVLAPRGLICPSDFQSMGFGLPAAIGAKLAAPDKPVITVLGDGGFLMSGLEFLTARRENVPVIAFVFNDGQLNQIRLQQWSEFGQAHGVELLNPDFRVMAQAFGIDYLRFGEAPRGEIERALAGTRPVLIEVLVGDSLSMLTVPVIRRGKEIARSAVPPSLLGWMKGRLARLRRRK